MRTDYLHAIPVAEWTPDEAYQHCLDTFQHNFRRFPDLMEPYIVSLDGAETNADRLTIMRQALRETFGRRAT